MNNEKVLFLERSNLTSLVWLIALVGVASVAPLFHQQMITGPVVNATLFLAAMILGIKRGIFVGLIPSAIALSMGTLPPVLAPAVPYIMISNAILIAVFSLLRNKNYWLAVAVASLLKFVFLFSTSSIVISLLMKKELAGSVATMMSWPQLITALFGGFLAWVFLKKLNLQN